LPIQLFYFSHRKALIRTIICVLDYEFLGFATSMSSFAFVHEVISNPQPR